MRIAILSPLPPSKSGIADYTAALVDAIPPLAAVDAFASLESLPDLSSYDAAIYQIGNNGDHAFVYQEAISNPGIVVLHEANLHHLIAEITIRQGDWDGYMRDVEFDGGPRALEFARAVRRLEVGPDYEGVPMLRKLLRRTRGLIVHSKYVGDIARQFGYEGPLAVIPHGAWLPEPCRLPWREKLGVAADEPVIGVFGHLKPYKRIAETLRAFRRLVRQNPKLRMILVGQPHPDFPVEQLIDALDLREQVRVIGFAPIEDFVGYLDACDVIVNLRYPTVGESSGTMLRAMGLGKPVMVSSVGAFAEYPDDVCLKVPVGGPAEEDLIYEYLRYLTTNPGAAEALGQNAREWVAEKCNWTCVAEQYIEFCREVAHSESETAPASDTTTQCGQAVSAEIPGDCGTLILEEEERCLPSSDFVDAPVATESRTGTDFGDKDASAGSSDAPDETEPHSDAPGVAVPDSEDDLGECLGQEDITPENGPSDAAEEVAMPSSLDHILANELLVWAPGEQARQYLVQHLSRLITTLELLPDGNPETSILEMGCYMQLTPALRDVKHYGQIRGCYFGTLGAVSRKQALSTDGREFSCDVDEFDAERDAYPYADNTFDVVLCTELFEHLGYDPMHCLTEVNRILKPGGHLLLSTPNACSLRAVAAVLDQYHPGFFPAFMRPNATGDVDPRHHREYAPREIRMAFCDAGFEVVELLTAPYWSAPEPQHEWVKHMLEHYELDKDLRGECIFALGRKSGKAVNRYPEWLYYGGEA